jgi:hypothetical protein
MAYRLFDFSTDIEDVSCGAFSYASMPFATRNLPKPLLGVLERMAEGLREPRVTFRCRDLVPGQTFGHGRWHRDGQEVKEEIHRLLTINGTPTEGWGGVILDAGVVWEYNGEYVHRARPATVACKRFILRVSQTEMIYRNHWSTL